MMRRTLTALAIVGALACGTTGALARGGGGGGHGGFGGGGHIGGGHIGGGFGGHGVAGPHLAGGFHRGRRLVPFAGYDGLYDNYPCDDSSYDSENEDPNCCYLGNAC
jgi:hypothetical protein